MCVPYCSDTPETIAKDLIAAGLVDGRNLVVGELISGLAGTDMLIFVLFCCCLLFVLFIAVAANIQKIIENPSLEKVVFQLVRL